MTRKRYKPEQILDTLRQIDLLLCQGVTVSEASRRLSLKDQTYYRWRKQYGGMREEQVTRLRELERENYQLKKLVAKISLDNAVLKETADTK